MRIFKPIKSRFKIVKDNFKNSKKVSKRQSWLLGFVTPLAIFGITLFGPSLSAIAKEVPATAPAPAPEPADLNTERLSGLAAAVCSGAVATGNFAVGVACGIVVVAGILYVQKKN